VPDLTKMQGGKHPMALRELSKSIQHVQMRKRLEESKYIYQKNIQMYNRLVNIENKYDNKSARSKSSLIIDKGKYDDLSKTNEQTKSFDVIQSKPLTSRNTVIKEEDSNENLVSQTGFVYGLTKLPTIK
jgi:acetyl-CoA carboxylase beta subunit